MTLPLTTNDALPKRPRGAARHVANAAAPGPTGAAPSRVRTTWVSTDPAQTSGVAVPPPAAPEPTLRDRAAMRARQRPRRPDLAVASALTLPLRTVTAALATARALPLTATAVAACLFVTVASPQSALATPPDTVSGTTSSTAAMDAQHFSTAGSVGIDADRDGFTVGRVPGQAARGILGAALPEGSPAVRPVDGSVPTAGGFGSRWVAGCAACSTNHEGLDFAAATGTPAVAAMSGVVVSAGVLGGYGNQVLVQHADGIQTRYGHLSQIGVRIGQVVSAGERVGAVGNTGVSTGSHLHFEVIVDGRHVDPAVWLGARGLL